METFWRFTNLASLADHLENKAKEQRESAARLQRRRLELIASASENESVAYLLRHTTITD